MLLKSKHEISRESIEIQPADTDCRLRAAVLQRPVVAGRVSSLEELDDSSKSDFKRESQPCDCRGTGRAREPCATWNDHCTDQRDSRFQTEPGLFKCARC